VNVREDPVREFLESRGCPEHIVEGGLDGLLEQWENAVDDVEETYPLGLDDYLDDMDGRELIEGAVEVAPAETRRAVLKRLQKADERMKALLVPAGRCLWGSDMAEQHDWTPQRNWWYFMQPADPGPELKEDLESRK
jgi:hypothetical protein